MATPSISGSGERPARRRWPNRSASCDQLNFVALHAVRVTRAWWNCHGFSWFQRAPGWPRPHTLAGQSAEWMRRHQIAVRLCFIYVRPCADWQPGKRWMGCSWLCSKRIGSNEHVQSKVCLGGGSNLEPQHDWQCGGSTCRQPRQHRKGFGRRSASALGLRLPRCRLARRRLAPRLGIWCTGGLARSRMARRMGLAPSCRLGMARRVGLAPSCRLGMARRMGLASSCRLGMARRMGLAPSCRLGMASQMGLAAAALRFRRRALGLARRRMARRRMARRWMARGRMARGWMARGVARRLGRAPLVARQSG
jgi:hypothetical protein